MGWTYTLDASRSDLVEERVRPWSNDRVRAYHARRKARRRSREAQESDGC
jgi:hypothetical protein